MESGQSEVRAGTIVGGQRVLHVLAQGRDRWVVAVEDIGSGRKRALKLRRSDADAPRAEQVTAALAELRHPHVVELAAYGVEAGYRWQACELLKGRTLRQMHEWEGVDSVERALRIAAQLAEALSAVHEAGVVHGDVSADHVLLVHRRGSPDFVKLIGFGAAELVGGAARRIVARRPADLEGRPEYMAPEKLAGRPYDARADVYSFGVVLYELVAGVPPFGGDFDRLVVAQLMRPPPRPRLRGRVGRVARRGLEGLIGRCLAKRPQDRPHSMVAVHRALQRIAARTDIAARRHHRAAAAIVTLLVLVAAIGLAFGLLDVLGLSRLAG